MIFKYNSWIKILNQRMEGEMVISNFQLPVQDLGRFIDATYHRKSTTHF